MVDGIPCTTVERTILDLASTYDQRRLESICERAAGEQRVGSASAAGMLRAGIERPIVNGRIEAGGTDFEVDFHWPRYRLIVETDGKAFPDSPTAARRDARRDRVRGAAGWHTLRFDWQAVTERESATLTSITDRLRARGA